MPVGADVLHRPRNGVHLTAIRLRRAPDRIVRGEPFQSTQELIDRERDDIAQRVHQAPFRTAATRSGRNIARARSVTRSLPERTTQLRDELARR